jgi:hypothetical protein
MDAMYSSKMSVDFQRTTRSYVTKDRNLHNHRCENITSHLRYFVLLLFLITVPTIILINILYNWMSLRRAQPSGFNVLQFGKIPNFQGNTASLSSGSETKKSKNQMPSSSCWFPACPTLRRRGLRRYVPPKCRVFISELHGVTAHGHRFGNLISSMKMIMSERRRGTGYQYCSRVCLSFHDSLTRCR